jgi:hypothetical protein
MSPETSAILTNKHAIAVNQDPLGKQAALIVNDVVGNTQVWVKQLSGHGTFAVAFLNRGNQSRTIELQYNDPKMPKMPGSSNAYDATDLWAGGKSLGAAQKFRVSATVPSTAAAFYKLTATDFTAAPSSQPELAPPAGQDGTGVFLTEAAKDGAVCLDGTPGAYAGPLAATLAPQPVRRA